MKRLRDAWFLKLCLAAGCALSACSQGEGATCQINEDCDDGLLCCIAPTAVRGTCASTLDRCSAQRPEPEPDDEDQTDGG
ncbi:MAG: hypothetical protein ABW321_02725 [Polyangiales bacterium]